MSVRGFEELFKVGNFAGIRVDGGSMTAKIYIVGYVDIVFDRCDGVGQDGICVFQEFSRGRASTATMS